MPHTAQLRGCRDDKRVRSSLAVEYQPLLSACRFEGSDQQRWAPIPGTDRQYAEIKRYTGFYFVQQWLCSHNMEDAKSAIRSMQSAVC